MRACWRYTRRRPERTRGGVLNLHTGLFPACQASPHTTHTHHHTTRTTTPHAHADTTHTTPHVHTQHHVCDLSQRRSGSRWRSTRTTDTLCPPAQRVAQSRAFLRRSRLTISMITSLCSEQRTSSVPRSTCWTVSCFLRRSRLTVSMITSLCSEQRTSSVPRSTCRAVSCFLRRSWLAVSMITSLCSEQRTSSVLRSTCWTASCFLRRFRLTVAMITSLSSEQRTRSVPLLNRVGQSRASWDVLDWQFQWLHHCVQNNGHAAFSAQPFEDFATVYCKDCFDVNWFTVSDARMPAFLPVPSNTAWPRGGVPRGWLWVQAVRQLLALIRTGPSSSPSSMPTRNSCPTSIQDILRTTVMCGRQRQRQRSSTPTTGSRHPCTSCLVLSATPNLFGNPVSARTSSPSRTRGSAKFSTIYGSSKRILDVWDYDFPLHSRVRLGLWFLCRRRWHRWCTLLPLANASRVVRRSCLLTVPASLRMRVSTIFQSVLTRTWPNEVDTPSAIAQENKSDPTSRSSSCPSPPPTDLEFWDAWCKDDVCCEEDHHESVISKKT